jgi:ATP-dependent DNA helicase RecG
MPPQDPPSPSRSNASVETSTPASESLTTVASAQQGLRARLERLPGVGSRRAERLAKLGLVEVRQALVHFPRDYKDFTGSHTVGGMVAGEHAAVAGEVVDVGSRTTVTGKAMVTLLLSTPEGALRGVWFGMPFIAKRFRVGSRVVLAGVARQAAGIWEMTHPEVRYLDADEASESSPWLAVYPLTDGVRQSDVRMGVQAALAAAEGQLQETFRPEELEARSLLPIHEAFRAVHFPGSREDIDAGRRRFIYQELYMLQLALRLHRRQAEVAHQAPVIHSPADLRSRIEGVFPFPLTQAQRRVTGEILTDMTRSTPMQRLLQGDVGSGKTAVAVVALLAAALTGHQGVIMAPTELLARQHLTTLQRILAGRQLLDASGHPLPVSVELLIGGQGKAAREASLARIAAGESRLIVGTQALVASPPVFHRLGLVVIDEQHRFGVVQRARLQQDGCLPHTLVMTATPIPRTVAHALYGDLDLSTIDEQPPGRQPVQTYRIGPNQQERWWGFFCRKLREGRRGYVVVPAVEESESGLASIDSALEELANGPLEAFRLGLVHGRLAADMKHSIMDDFRRGRIDVIVATSVVEVGIDVPEATIMTILDADRFGLAQLHQLRGRVARGATRGICGAVTAAATDHPRLQAFVDTTDGFRLSEIDLIQRGPGELVGTKQSGVPPLCVADILRDADVAAEAREHAIATLAENPFLEGDDFSRLRKLVVRRWGESLDLGGIG